MTQYELHYKNHKTKSWTWLGDYGSKADLLKEYEMFLSFDKEDGVKNDYRIVTTTYEELT